jgi:hypothetical protein
MIKPVTAMTAFFPIDELQNRARVPERAGCTRADFSFTAVAEGAVMSTCE